MEEINSIVQSLHGLIDEIPSKIRQFSIEEIKRKPKPEKWSKKEILGHLCDSAFNNLQRLIHVQYEEKPHVNYDQDEWVKNQNYQGRNINEVIELWIALHQQLLHVIKSFPEEKLESIIDVGEEVTARFIITDYLKHQNHHFRQIF